MKKRVNKRKVVGKVISDKMDKTVVIQVEKLVKHSLYKKYIKRQNKFTAHDEKNECRIGDKVVITESRPISRMKRWRVSGIVEKAVSVIGDI
jgi:small subunit ribosomal protein S17